MKQDKKFANLEEFVAYAKTLRDAAKAAEERFLDLLVWAESGIRELWAASGWTYEQFLKHTNLCDVARFAGYKRIKANNLVTPQMIAKAGVEAACVAGTLPEPEQQKNVIDRAIKSVEANGVQPSEQTVNAYKREERTKAAVSRGAGAKGYASLADETTRLRATLAERDAEIVALRAENAKLKAELKAIKVPVKAAKSAAKKAA